MKDTLIFLGVLCVGLGACALSIVLALAPIGAFIYCVYLVCRAFGH